MQEWRLWYGQSRYKKGRFEKRLTHGSDNLSLETELVLETTGEVGNTALAVACNVGDLADVVEHVATGEEQDGDQADCGPEVAALKDGQSVWSSNGKGGHGTEDGNSGCDDLDVVDGTDNGRSRARYMAREPGVDRFGTDDTVLRLALTVHSRLQVAYPVVKSKRRG